MGLAVSSVFAVAMVFVLAACGRQQVIQHRQIPQLDPAKTAQQLFQRGDYGGAARLYLRLAEISDPTHSDTYRLLAAEAFAESGDVNQARRIINSTSTATGTQVEILRKAILARIYLLENNPTRALSILPDVGATDAPAWIRMRIHESRAKAYEILGNALEAVRQRVLLDPLLADGSLRSQNRQATWTAVNTLTTSALQRLKPLPPDPLGGWMELAIIAKSKLADHETLTQRIGQWKRRYPGHPADPEILKDLFYTPVDIGYRPAQIAILLPFEGQFAQAAAAVRDGFITAWYEDISNPRRPVLRIYDANARNIADTYEKAVGDGAEIVVGPLEKTAVKVLAESETLPRVTLALNQLESSSPDLIASALENKMLYQFGLLPEDEARQIADRAWLDGHTRALAIFPEGEWGSRIFHAFGERWESLGGTILEHQTYARNLQDYSVPVRRLLNVDSATLNLKLRDDDIDYVPRRQDADFIFMAAFPIQARQIYPLLRFYNAIQLPVYATSHVYSIPENNEPDNDLNGVVFGDMPWILGQGDDQGAGIFHKIQRNWTGQTTAYLRLYALGIDAYRIIPHLRRLQSKRFARFDGETGTLRMDAAGHLHRQLTWAKFVGGEPRLLGEADTLQ